MTIIVKRIRVVRELKAEALHGEERLGAPKRRIS
jgi:hypothetical protein